MHRYSLTELCSLLRAREVSCEEVAETFLARIEALDPRLNSFISVTADRARERARHTDAALAERQRGRLSGIPIAHKDIFCTAGTRTSCGSRMLDGFISPDDATVVRRLGDAGAISLGKTNMDEFAMGSSGENSYYGAVRNPWDLDRVPGGSSSGSAAAVAAGLVPAATGTDTGGSIRQPAAFCGITGLKPTYGRVSRYGMVAFASSLDQGGPLARSAADVALLLESMAGFDERDSTSVNRDPEDYSAALAGQIAGLRIGLPKEHFAAGIDAGVAQAVDEALAQFRRLGAETKEITLPHSHLSIPTYYIVAPAECSSNLSRYDGVRFGYRALGCQNLEELYKRSRGEGFGTEVKRRIMVGTYALSAGYYDAYYLKAQKMRRLISQDFRDAFSTVDVIMGPTAPTVAFKLGEKVNNPVAMYLSDVFTIAVNLAGLPAISIPIGFAGHLPVGLQIIGNYFNEGKLLNVAHQYQLDTDWHTRRPPAFD